MPTFGQHETGLRLHLFDGDIEPGGMADAAGGHVGHDQQQECDKPANHKR
jgi:hypothetical protein